MMIYLSGLEGQILYPLISTRT